MKGCVKFRENTQIWVGHNSRTTRPIELKFSKSSFLAKITRARNQISSKSDGVGCQIAFLG